MRKLTLVLALVAASASAQFNTRGTQSYRNALTANNEFGIPRFTTVLLPTCATNNLGALAWDTTTSSTKICNGTSWAAVSASPAIDACPQTDAHSICKGDSTIVFEGATANDFETTITVIDPVVDSTFSIGHSPDGNPWIGATAGDSATSDDVDNVFLGEGAGTASGAAVTATDNTCIGDFSCDALTSGDNNVSIGSGTDAGTTGSYNTCVGAASCPNVLATDGSTVIGYGADAIAANSVSIGRAAISGAAGSVSVGYQAGAAQLSTSANNTLLGYQAGVAIDNADGDDNTFLGYQAGLASNAVSTDNTCVGKSACDSVTTGDNNTIIGSDADGLATGTDMTAIGQLATVFANGGIAIGSGAENSDGVSIGTAAGDASAAADVDNVFIGTNAGTAANGTSTDNTCVGDNACAAVTTTDSLVAVGADALALTVADGIGTVAVGFQAGDSFSNNAGNTFVGYKADAGVANRLSVTALGNQTLVHESYGTAVGTLAETSDGVSVGAWAGDAQAAADVDNVFVGNSSGTAANGTSTDNTCVGDLACDGLTTGDGNTIIGADADLVTATESNVIAIGKETKAGDTGGISIGYQAGDAQVAGSASNTLVGYQAGTSLNDAEDDHNTFVGYQAGDAAAGGGADSSKENTCVGSAACGALTTADFTVAVGRNAGDTVTSGGYGVFIGYNSDTNANANTNVVAVGASASADLGGVAIGGTAVGLVDYGVAIGQQAEAADGVAIGYLAGGPGTGTADLDNVFVGSRAGTAHTGTSTDNTYVGDLSGDAATTGDGNVLLGANTDLGTATDSNTTVVGESMVSVAGGTVTLGENGGVHYSSGLSVSLTDNTATAVIDIAVASNSYVGGTIHWTVTATDGTPTDYQALAGITTIQAVNKGGTETCTVTDNSNTGEAASAGTLTVDSGCTVGLTDEVRFTLDADSSLTSPTIVAYLTILLNGTGTTIARP